MRSLAPAALLLCVTLWQYPLGIDNPMGQAVQTTMEIRACEGTTNLSRPLSGRVLEVWRVLRFVEGSFISEVMEIRLPWGTDALPK